MSKTCLNIGMYLDQKFGFIETLDYTTLPKFHTLTAAQQMLVAETFDNAFHSSKHMGINIALGKAHENIKALIEHMAAQKPVITEQPVPPSIFAGLSNCE